MAFDAIKFIGLSDGVRSIWARGTDPHVRKTTFSGLNPGMLSKVPVLIRYMPQDIDKIQIVDQTIKAPADLLEHGLSKILESTIVNYVQIGKDWNKNIMDHCIPHARTRNDLNDSMGHSLPYDSIGVLFELMASVQAGGFYGASASDMLGHKFQAYRPKISINGKPYKEMPKHRGISSWLKLEGSATLQLLLRLNRYRSSFDDFLVVAVPIPGITVEDVCIRKIKPQQ
jgi:hypothetical protein